MGFSGLEIINTLNLQTDWIFWNFSYIVNRNCPNWSLKLRFDIFCREFVQMKSNLLIIEAKELSERKDFSIIKNLLNIYNIVPLFNWRINVTCIENRSGIFNSISPNTGLYKYTNLLFDIFCPDEFD
jgi:hypothetical protein